MSKPLENVDPPNAGAYVKAREALKKYAWLPVIFLIALFWALLYPIGWFVLIAVVAAAAYLLLRPRTKLDDAIKESNYEKFRRLEGLYRTIPDSVLEANKAANDKFIELQQQLEGFVDPKSFRFTRDDADDFVHNLHLAFLQIATVDYLRFNIQALESEYRQAVGAAAYEAYLGAIIHKPNDPGLSQDDRDRLLRSEATYLVNETRRQQLLRQHVQSTRQSLLSAAFRSWWANVIPLLGMLVAFLLCLSWVKTAIERPGREALDASGKTTPDASAKTAPDTTPKPTTGASANPTSDATVKETSVAAAHTDKAAQFADQYLLFAGPKSQIATLYTPVFKALMIMALLCLAGLAGATGGTMSVIQRVQTSTPENDPMTDLLALSQAQTAVFFAPVTGMIFAFVLSLFFAGGVLGGSVFPNFQEGEEWFFVLFKAKPLAIWLLWAFVAGFCERVVPDALDTLAKQQSDNNIKAPPAGAGNAPRNQGQADTGTKTDFKPTLDPHPDAIPPDATELTITGHNFDQKTAFYVDNQQMVVRDSTLTSLRVGLTSTILKNKTQISAKAKNPGDNGGESNVVQIDVSAPGG